MQYTIPQSAPITLSSSSEMKVYGLFSVAIGLTACGVALGGLYAQSLFTGGTHLMLLIAELAIIFTARAWERRSPLNILLFCVFPLLSGITIAPYLWYVSRTYTNGNAILLNALIATTFMATAAGLFARTTSWNLSALGRTLMMAVLGLIGMGLLQIFFPALRQSLGLELVLSGAGVLIFALFTAYDMQRIQRMGAMGASPFMMALSLYLDIFNLFLYLLRFMTAISGDR